MESLNTPHLLVIGGTGFIGHYLVKEAKRKGWLITSVSLKPPTKERFVDDIRYIHLDMTDINLVRKYLNEEFDYVVNLGGYIDHNLFREGGRDVIEVQFIGLQNLLEVLPRHKLKRFVQIGSSDEYGNAQAPQNEDFREQPISPYSLGKVAATHFLQMLHRTEKFPAVTLRLFLTYGPGQDTSRFLPQIIQGCLRNETFPASAGEQLRDFCYVDDTVRGIMQTLVVPEVEGEVINLATGVPVSIREMIETIRTLIGTGFPQYGKIPYRPGENMKLYASNTKKMHILKIQPQVCLKEGLLKTIKSYE